MTGELSIGIIGSALILLAFVLNEFHLWSEDDLKYDAVNFIGGVLLVWYSWILDSWPFIVLNGVWAVVALRDIVLDLRHNDSEGAASRK